LVASVAQAASGHAEFPVLSHEGVFIKPCGVATDSAGDLYVVERKTGKVKIYDSGGSSIIEFTVGTVRGCRQS
jgi:hypothetical protein